jgi:hypothetical protein
MISQSFATLIWLINLFNPPPLASMSRLQKVGRVFLVTLTLMLSCTLTAMLGAVGIFLIQRERAMLSSMPELLGGLEIIFTGVCVNAICVVVLFQVKKADRKLMSAQP